MPLATNLTIATGTKRDTAECERHWKNWRNRAGCAALSAPHPRLKQVLSLKPNQFPNIQMIEHGTIAKRGLGVLTRTLVRQYRRRKPPTKTVGIVVPLSSRPSL